MRNSRLFPVFLIVLVAMTPAVSAVSSGGGGYSIWEDRKFVVDSGSFEITRAVRADTSYDVKLTTGRIYVMNVQSIGQSVDLSFQRGSTILHTAMLHVGETTEVDLDSDNITDIEIVVDGISEEATLTIRQLKENNRKATAAPATPHRATPPEPPSDFGLKCGGLETIQERVDCRLGLSPHEAEEEYVLEFLPEECRALRGNARGACVSTYKIVQTCWEHPVGVLRITCVREQLGLSNNSIQSHRAACKAMQSPASCEVDLQTKVFNLVKFRFYDLEERAEYLEEKGVSRATIADFIVAIEEKKIAFNEAGSIEERKSVVLAVRDLWKSFVQSAREEMVQ